MMPFLDKMKRVSNAEDLAETIITKIKAGLLFSAVFLNKIKGTVSSD
jgi:hypothetical protein